MLINIKKTQYCLVSARMVEIYDSSTNTNVEVHTEISTKMLSSVLLQRCSAAKYFQPIAYYSKKFKNA